ncbi:hypothetical protein F5Y13DRAFT_163361 [Hypoxylon sp. FL1857]|nr:hypothetical protein F5Y13DRAFT_163361 [Hypoxylon sp. FL1857]
MGTWSIPHCPYIRGHNQALIIACVAQSVERETLNLKVAGKFIIHRKVLFVIPS